MPNKSELKLSGFNFTELFNPDGLTRLDQQFLNKLSQINPLAYSELLAYRQESKAFKPVEVSELLLNCAPVLEDFLIELFNISTAAAAAQVKTVANNPISIFKKFFVLKQAKKNLQNASNLSSFSELDHWLTKQLKHATLQSDDKELAVALLGNQYLDDTEKYADEITKLTQWCIQAILTPEGQKQVAGWSSFYIPERIQPDQLVKYTSTHDKWGRLEANPSQLILRDGFKLTDPPMDARRAQDQVNYCIYCHDHDGDFCSKGFPNKKSDPTQGLKKNALDVTLTGCPLEEKISEMQLLKRDGYTLASLAMVMVDNPMCPATGHRICNDCMKACIYQKQEPVNIPQIETRVLIDVLNLPWGVEIYDLLTRWNPLRQKQWLMKPYNGLKIMIAGMGPAGFTLAHHLLLEGFAVVGFDGLKIEPLPKTFIHEPIYSFDDIKEKLDERLVAGFGGVAEYGITVRWDKNFLKLIYISLMRKPHFQVFGSVRFGGTIKIDDAWDMGFDHFVVAVGAGLPKALPIPGSLAPGMRQANDFLMALQLSNAAKNSSLTNVQVRLPAVIIGGGLTGVDTATEVQAYYIRQVEKTLFRFEKLCQKYGDEKILKKLDACSLEILQEFLTHAKAVKKEREQAATEKRKPNFIKLIRQWGGVTIVYRRTMQKSPAYINNHEELQKALQEGVYYLEELEPTSVDLNQFGHVETLICHHRSQNDTIRLPARSIFVATGTQPNTAYEFEHKGTFNRLGLQYQHYEDIEGNLTIPQGVEHCKNKDFGPFTSFKKQHHRVSLIGDTHPVFHGSVVKAIASGMRTYPKILSVLKEKISSLKMSDQEKLAEYDNFAAQMEYLFNAHIQEVTRRSDNVLELIVKAPLAAKHFQPGQFYRLQNYETFSPNIDTTSLQIEPLALLCAEANNHHGTLKFMVIENGASSKLCATFRPGDPVSLMGPTGIRAKVASEQETILIIGNQLSLAMAMSYGKALIAQGNRVIFLGFFNRPEELYCQEKIEQVTNVAIWTIKNNSAGMIHTTRPEDYSTYGDPVEALLKYAHGKLDPNKPHPEIPLTDVDRIYLIGDTNLLRNFQAARNIQFKDLLIKQPRIFGSVYSTMQCMLKGVCAQCLQWQIDPETGQRTKAVFTCSWPEQPLEIIDFDNIDERQVQNRLQEQLSSLWVDYLFDEYKVPRI